MKVMYDFNNKEIHVFSTYLLPYAAIMLCVIKLLITRHASTSEKEGFYWLF